MIKSSLKRILSAEDISYIEKNGLKAIKNDELLHLDDEGKVIFTLKGRAMVQYAIEHHGHEGDISSIQNLRDFYLFKLDIQGQIIRSLKRKLASLQEATPGLQKYRALTAAILYGSQAQILDTLKKTNALSDSGKNLVLLPQIKKSTHCISGST